MMSSVPSLSDTAIILVGMAIILIIVIFKSDK